MDNHESNESNESVPLENIPKPPSFEEGSPPAYVEVQRTPSIPAVPLRRSRRSFALALFYSVFALFSWIVLCLLRSRPLTTSTYAYDDGWYPSEHHWRNTWRDNEKWYLAARIFQAIAGLSVIPISSAVCAHAAAVFAQRNHISLKQLLFLADGSYASPQLYRNIITNGAKWARKNGSSFWACAALLHIVGAMIWPIQAGLISPRNIKVQSDQRSSDELSDLTAFDPSSSYAPQVGGVALAAGMAMQDYESQGWLASVPQLWGKGYCGDDDYDTCDGPPRLGEWKDMPHRYFAELPAGHNTGVRRHFIPRVNFTTEFTCLNRSTWEWPAECDDEQALLFDYRDQLVRPGVYSGWSIRVCMPPDSTNSPWKATRDRQDFKETLYINATKVPNHPDLYDPCLAKIELKTTAGMFELPNYMNDGKPGPLLAKDPMSTHEPAAKRDPITDIGGLRPFLYDTLPGPLYAATMSLFGTQRSFLAQCMAAVEYDRLAENITSQVPGARCPKFPPLSSLLPDDYVPRKPKSKRWSHGGSVNEGDLRDWLGKFQTLDTSENAHAMENAFSSAAFFATSALFREERSPHGIYCYSDDGMDTLTPEFPFAGLVVVSILLGLYLLGLWAMATYAYSPAWTPSLDSFAILRIGARLGDHVPLKISYLPRAIAALDHLPGWVGEDVDNDAVDDEGGRPAKLAVGSERGLTSKRNYECYPIDAQQMPMPRTTRQR